ncbi:MAG: xanthine dehydrogenase family protein molybdopterin-binding subunit [Ignavibacteriales bacterium]|nr:xanthine dehydrogenase family protein molybdopterin-binding subunit [Ignavibacteriales bacterium]
MNTTSSIITRREFVKVVSIAGGGLVLGFYLPSKEEALLPEMVPTTSLAPNAWLRVDRNGIVTVTVARSEMGQGVQTSLPMIVAEELEADWSSVRIEPAVVDPKYGDMTTGGSRSIRSNWLPLRKAGATAREMLVAAAADTWKVDRATCRAENGAVLHPTTNRKLSFGQLAEKAALLPVPSDPPLKKPDQFRIVGRSVPRLDSVEKVKGNAIFGIDMTLPDMLVAVIARCPTLGGKVKSFDASKALAVTGVRQVLQVESGIAVVAESTWAAMRGREMLSVAWDEGPNNTLSSADIEKIFEEKSKQEGLAVRKEGDTAAAFTSAAKRLSAIYTVPFLAHATMEPMNCLVHVRETEAEVWAPTQSPQWSQRAVAGVAGLPLEKVKIHTTLLGGGFGRRLMWDYTAEAAEVSKRIGRPVKVVWNREDDMQHDYYRPASYHRMEGALDSEGRLTSWAHHVVAPSISAQLFPNQPRQGPPDAVDGAAQLPYAVPNILIDYVMANTPVPIAWWRSVYNSQNPFANECFIDEVAVAAAKDPYEFRLQLLPPASRLRAVLELAATKAGWGKALPSGKGRGIACHACFGSFIAQVAEVSIKKEGSVKVDRIICAVDCGQVVNPDTVKAQIEGGVIFGLTAALKGEITIKQGRVQQSNFDDYELLRFDETPTVEVHIRTSAEEPTGIGEPGVPPVAPAVCNAIFAATGKRIRRLPILDRS